MKSLRALALCGICLFIAACSMGSKEAPLPYRQAEDAFRLGNYEKAATAYQVFLDSGQRSDLIPRAYFKMAASEFRREKYDETVRILDEFQARYPREKYPQMFALRGDVEEVRGNLVAAITNWEQAYDVAEDEEREKVRLRIDDALASMNSTSLTAVAGVVTNEDVRAMVEVRQKGGGPPRTRARGERRGTDGAAGTSPAIPVGTGRLACLLPLSGAYSIYGTKSLEGLNLGLGDRAGELVVRDTRGDTNAARLAIEELARDPSIVAVIGPLRSEVTEAIAPVAEAAGLPLLLLSQRDASQGRYVFQIALTPAAQAAALSRYATKDLGLARFGILHPNDAYGSNLAEAFKLEVNRLGGRIVGMQSYPPDAREFGVERLSAKQWHEKEGLEAVFLPDSPDRAGVLGGELRRSMPQIALLGGNAWNDRKALSDVSLGLEGGIFVDGFFEASTREATRAFVNAFSGAKGTTPGILEAQAYDAARIARRVLASGVRNRGEFAAQLATLGDYEGASGRMRFDSTGMSREAFVMQLSRGVLREIAVAEVSVRQFAPAAETEAVTPVAGESN